jgi:PilZ domain
MTPLLAGRSAMLLRNTPWWLNSVPACWLDGSSQYQKFEAVVLDISSGGQVYNVLQKMRTSASNKTAVAFAISSNIDETAYALKQGFSFVLERPLAPESIRHTLKVAYGLILRERRRYFRCPVVAPVVLTTTTNEVFYGRAAKVSETGIALSTSIALSSGVKGTAQFKRSELSLPITADYRVCWANTNGDAGLSFLFMPFEQASELQAWLARRLEEELPQTVADRFRSLGDK